MFEKKLNSRTKGASLDLEENALNARQAFIEILTMILVAIAVPMVVYLDIVVLFGNVREVSLTEASQFLLLGVNVALFAWGAFRLPHVASYLWVMASFSLLMLIREMDGLLDFFAQGAWLYPAIACIAVGAAIFWRDVDTCSNGFLRHFSSRHGAMVFLGLFVLIVFSRVFGSGNLWRPILVDDYMPTTKAAIQEGLELLGYAVFTFGAIGSWKNDFR